MTSITIERITAANAGLYEAFLAQAGGQAAVSGFRAGRRRRDLLAAPDFWLLLALSGEAPAGTAAAVVVPKADARAGFLFLDELEVLPAFRRQGVARALLAHVEALAQQLGLAGVRLLVRPDNDAARRLYAQAGYRESGALFCEKVITPP